MRNTKRKSKILFLVIMVICTSCSSYSKIMSKAVKKAVGEDFKEYYAYSYPTNNFGLITTYETKLSYENQYCAMAACLDGLEINSMEEWLHFGGLADVGKGGPITISENKKTKIASKTILPKLWNAINIEGALETEKEVTTTLELGPASVRFLNKKKFEEYIDNLSPNNKYKQKYNAKNLIIIVSDVVVEYMSVKIKVNSDLAAQLDAAIEAGEITSKLGKVDLDAKLERSTSGTYELTIDKPVIVLRLAKKQPSMETIMPIDTFEDWENVIDFIED